MILKNIAISNSKFPNLSLKLNVSANSALHMKRLQITAIYVGKISSWKGKTGDLKIEFEWVPCCSYRTDCLGVLCTPNLPNPLQNPPPPTLHWSISHYLLHPFPSDKQTTPSTSQKNAHKKMREY